LLLKQDFTGFNGNVHNRKAEIEGALDACSHIKLVVPYTGDGVSQTAIDALQVLLDDEDLDEERLDKQVEYYAAVEITRDLLAEQAYPPVHTDIALQKHEKVENPRTTYYGIARLADLVALHKTRARRCTSATSATSSAAADPTSTRPSRRPCATIPAASSTSTTASRRSATRLS
jgi:hypothetical protein